MRSPVVQPESSRLPCFVSYARLVIRLPHDESTSNTIASNQSALVWHWLNIWTVNENCQISYNAQIIRPDANQSQIIVICTKRGLRACVSNLRTPLPDEQRRSCGTPDGPDGSGDAESGNEAETKIRGIQGGARQLSYGASCFCLSPRSLKSIVSEEICGRFGSFDGSSSSYRAGSDAPFGV
jgi:hypothetical protein